MEENQIHIEWEAPEYEHYDRDASWYWTSIVITVLIVGFAIWQKNFLFALFAIVAEIIIFSLKHAKPRTYRFRIGHKGLDVGERFFSWKDFEHFSVLELDGKMSELVFRRKGKLGNFLKIPAFTDELREISEYLALYLPEHEHEEGLPDLISKFIKF